MPSRTTTRSPEFETTSDPLLSSAPTASAPRPTMAAFSRLLRPPSVRRGGRSRGRRSGVFANRCFKILIAGPRGFFGHGVLDNFHRFTFTFGGSGGCLGRVINDDGFFFGGFCGFGAVVTFRRGLSLRFRGLAFYRFRFLSLSAGFGLCLCRGVLCCLRFYLGLGFFSFRFIVRLGRSFICRFSLGRSFFDRRVRRLFFLSFLCRSVGFRESPLPVFQ